MNLKSNISNIHLHSPFKPHSIIPLIRRRTVQIRQYPVWKHRRHKIRVRNQLGSSPSDHLFSSLNSLQFIAPTLGFASGLAFYLSRLASNSKTSQLSDIGEWILLTSPTPFNRFVILRCPSISFDGSELLEDVNERLVKEDRHFVRLNSGRIYSDENNTSDYSMKEKLEYQRLCVSTDDGGVISLDWPSNLDLKEEHGLDTTVLLIPGTAEGSADQNIRSFVCQCLNRGCFPVVMNPRGCARSPLTTARLFTAADSDDVCTAIQFINGARPWTTLVGVGWGYGANMLTKYLAEVGEKTPLVAATCIDNPFDLEEATRSSPYYHPVHHKLTAGLIDILQSNKETFQGPAKGFDVEKALLAKSLRDFEKEISMVSYGFNAIEDFYKKSGTQGVVGDVKIPLLFIQNDAGTAPQFSIPRSLIAENPFTSLLLCSCPNITTNEKSTISWSQHLAIEWLAAVELGLLKGRHPLLKDVDVTINPANGLALMEAKASKRSDRVERLLSFPHSDDLNGRPEYPSRGMVKAFDTSANINLRSRGDTQTNYEVNDKVTQQEKNGALGGASSVDAEAEIVEEGVVPEDVERGQVLQTAEVVLNMLDVTMPDTLTEEQKKKVLAAMGQGETLMNALQGAVPEDVRGKLTTAVSGILQNQGSNLKLEGLLNIGQIPNILNRRKQSSAVGIKDETNSSETSERAHDLEDSSNKNQPGTGKSVESAESEVESSENIQLASDTTGSDKKGTSELGDGENKENVPETDARTDSSDTKEDTPLQQTAERSSSDSTDQKMSSSSADETFSASSSETPLETKGSEDQKREEKSTQQPPPVPTETTPSAPSFSVSQAFDALTGMDDSTQVAVNSVFTVIEDMITQLEVERDDGVQVKDKSKDNDQKSKENDQNKSSSPDDNHQHIINKEDTKERKEGNEDKSKENDQNKSSSPDENQHHIMKKEDSKQGHNGDSTTVSDKLDDINLEIKKTIQQSAISSGGDNIGSLHTGNLSSNLGSESGKGEQLVTKRISSEHSEKNHKLLEKNIPRRIIPAITSNPYGDSLYKEYLGQYLISKMQNTESMDLDTTTALFLDYFPEEGQWKLLDPADSTSDVVAYHKDVESKVQLEAAAGNEDKIIEPSYEIFDSEKQEDPVGGTYKEEIVYGEEDKSNKSVLLVKNILLDSLKVEVGRRLSAEGPEEMELNLAKDLDYVANSVSQALANEKEFLMFVQGQSCALESVTTVHGERMVTAISSAVEETRYLKRVLPVGVIVGSSLASLRKLFNVAPVHVDNQSGELVDEVASRERNSVQSGEIDNDHHQQLGLYDSIRGYEEEADEEEYDSIRGYEEEADEEEEPEGNTKSLNNNVMVGAVTAALGASALLAHQQGSYIADEITGTSSMSFGGQRTHSETGELEDKVHEKTENNIVTSIAEKAMSVAGPVVPTKEDGGLDQERLVAVLAEWGQRGGMLRLVGKLALLWGGLRGATSLTEKLMSFLHISERPLLQRILGFMGMSLILWIPVVVPLLPTLVQGWATNNSSQFAEFACIVGLYASVIIMVRLWGKKIRGYENPLVQYGLDFTSTQKIQNFVKGLIGGVVLVMLTQSVNVFLGCVHLSLPSTPSSSSSDAVTLFKVYGQMLIVLGKGIVTATGVALVEELLFRSWLPDEIAVDLGYQRGIIISGLAFSLFQRSPWAAPGLWLLSVGLAGARERNHGSLSLPIGLRAGVIASSFILQTGGFFKYQPNLPIWVTGANPSQPFSGIVGMSFALFFAVLLYPRQSPPHLLQTPEEEPTETNM